MLLHPAVSPYGGCVLLHPRELTQRVTQQLQSIQPLSDPVLEALQEFNGYTPPKVRLFLLDDSNKSRVGLVLQRLPSSSWRFWSLFS
jgi:hypothetical protein